MAVNMPTNHTKTYIWAIMAGATFLSSCVAMPRAPYDFPEDETARAPLNPNYETAPVITPTQQAGAQPMYPYGGMMPMPQGYPLPALNVAQDPAVLDLKQRLDRAEQALLRLDRRMQLVERNELGRMGGLGSAIGPTLSSQVAPLVAAPQVAAVSFEAAPGSMNEERTLAAMASMGQNLYQQGIQPVSSPRDTTIRGSLQAAPTTLGGALPSLADPRNNSQPIPNSAGQIAIWTVRYEPEKIWPDRDQLPDSRIVVDALRQSRTLTVVARGPNTKSSVFQERVRALSRYLAKVASLDTVPISTLATPGLDANTIEILATP